MNDLNNWEDKYRDETRTDDELFAIVGSKDVDEANEEYWIPMGCLQHRLPAIAPRVEGLLKSDNPKTREDAATIFGQNRCSQKWNAPYCVDLLLAAASRETAAGLLAAILDALGNLHDQRTIADIIALQRHPDSEIRLAVTHALARFEDERAIQALIELSADADFDVRNWATFNLGSMIDADTASIRSALVARLLETNDEIKGEAIVGLSRRGDVRATPPLLDYFDNMEAGTLRDWILIQEAVEAITDVAKQKPEPVWIPILLRAKSLGLGDLEQIQTALEKCASPQ